MKPIESVNTINTEKMIVEKILPAIRDKWPKGLGRRPNLFSKITLSGTLAVKY